VSASGWTDFLTAISTAATAATIAAGFYTWRRDNRFRAPIVEFIAQWASLGGERYIDAHLIVRNQFSYTIFIDSVRMKRPRRMRIATEKQLLKPDVNSRGNLPTDTLSSVDLNYQIRPIGGALPVIYSQDGRTHLPGDVSNVHLYLIPPINWSEGALKIEIKVSRTLQKVQHKRITIKRTINARQNSV
jgi:hypothetical protein